VVPAGVSGATPSYRFKTEDLKFAFDHSNFKITIFYLPISSKFCYQPKANFQLRLCQNLKSKCFYKPQDLKIFELLHTKP
jgi:hypothetical protein